MIRKMSVEDASKVDLDFWAKNYRHEDIFFMKASGPLIAYGLCVRDELRDVKVMLGICLDCINGEYDIPDETLEMYQEKVEERIW